MKNLSINKLICELVSGSTTKLTLESETKQWELFFETTKRHRLAQYIYYLLTKKDNSFSVPQNIISQFQEIFHYTSAVNFRLFFELEKILKCLKEKKIKVILLKGAYLAQEIYDSPGLRPMQDFDILVHKKDLNTIIQECESLGFTLYQPFFMDALEVTQIHIPALRKPGPQNQPSIDIEFHWGISRPQMGKEVNVNQLWERAQSIKTGKIETLGLSPEDNLHHLALHCAYDDLFGNGLIQLLDVAKIIEKKSDKIDWDLLLRISSEAETSRYTFLVLYLAKIHLGTEIPEEFLNKIKPPDLNHEIIELANDMLFKQNDPDYWKAEFIGRTLGGGISEKTTGLFRKVFPTRAELSETYGTCPNSVSIWFYYPVRWKDLIFRYISVSSHILLGDKSLKSAVKLGKRGKKLKNWLVS